MRDSSGVIPDPSSKDTIIGGHAVCIVGYDDAKKRLKFKNSWSRSWGDAGCAYISYSYAEKNLSEAWVLEL
jgi:C1A family cysteine protease